MIGFIALAFGISIASLAGVLYLFLSVLPKIKVTTEELGAGMNQIGYSLKQQQTHP